MKWKRHGRTGEWRTQLWKKLPKACMDEPRPTVMKCLKPKTFMDLYAIRRLHACVLQSLAPCVPLRVSHGITLLKLPLPTVRHYGQRLQILSNTPDGWREAFLEIPTFLSSKMHQSTHTITKLTSFRSLWCTFHWRLPSWLPSKAGPLAGFCYAQEQSACSGQVHAYDCADLCYDVS